MVEEVIQELVPINAGCTVCGDRFRSFVVDVIVQDCRVLTYAGGVDLAVRIQNQLRRVESFGWSVHLWVQPVAEDLELDFGVWLEIDRLSITEFMGKRDKMMFPTFTAFKAACWG